MFANFPPLIEGPFRNSAGGVDISLPVTVALAAIVYLILLFAVPEPRYAFGPQGPRFVPVRGAEPPPITDNPNASALRQRRHEEVTRDNGG
jgi:hypothetical protein